MILWKGGSRPRSKAYWPIRLKVPKCCAFTKISQKNRNPVLETYTKFKLKDKSILNLKWLTRLLVVFGSTFKKNVLVLWKNIGLDGIMPKSLQTKLQSALLFRKPDSIFSLVSAFRNPKKLCFEQKITFFGKVSWRKKILWEFISHQSSSDASI